MIISVWRYSHLALALSSLVFVLTLSITGIILAFDPIAASMQNQENVDNHPGQTVGETIAMLKTEYPEVLNLSVDHNGFASVSVITENGDIGDFYINPESGEKTGSVRQQSQFMKDVTSLHRSLFLKTPGRIFIGLSSFLLFLIVVSGLILIIKRQQGIRNFFEKIVKENFSQHAHVYLGRIALLPLVLITLSGVYLSLLRFNLLPDPVASHNVDYENIRAEPAISVTDFPIFKNTPLSEVRSIEFPFSDDPADCFTLSLSEKEVVVNQYTGEVLSEVSYPVILAISEFAMLIHTGHGSFLWSVILGLSAAAILFFIYSGFRMTFRRRAGRIRNSFRKDQCKYYILVGSETGTTMRFARTFYEQLKSIGVKSYIAQLNDFKPYSEMENLVVFTATYGQGEAPANAQKFASRIQNAAIEKPFNYSVVGFGSRAYPDFCKFAFDVDSLLGLRGKSTRLMEPFTINSRSTEAFKEWEKKWSKRTGLELPISNGKSKKTKIKGRKKFKVLQTNTFSDTFVIQLEAVGQVKMTSGDLLAVYPPDGSHERLYSAGVLADGKLVISVKRHEFGICSNYLHELIEDDWLEARVVKNKKFHFPSKANQVILISSGTGIAPFVGMLDQNKSKVHTTLYWGGKTEESFCLYQKQISNQLNKRHLYRFEPAYSREQHPKKYVQDLILRDIVAVAKMLRENGVILICGSIAMQKGVSDILDRIVQDANKKPLSYYQNKNQIRMDCY